MTSSKNNNSYRSKKIKPSHTMMSTTSSSSSSSPDSENENSHNRNYNSIPTSTTTTTTSSSNNSSSSCTVAGWSGFETIGMRRAKCSLLLQTDDTIYDAIIKKLPKQRVYIHRTNHSSVRNNNNNANTTTTTTNPTMTTSITNPNHDTTTTIATPPLSSSSLLLSTFNNHNNTTAPNVGETTQQTYNDDDDDDDDEASYPVDFDGATILQLVPSISPMDVQNVMPITITVAGKCVFTPENYIDFSIMMRSKEQSINIMHMKPNSIYDWPDITSLLLCPICSNICSIPRIGDRQEHEYWMIYYPLLQITTSTTHNNTNANNDTNNHGMVLSTRTICRLTCLDCMDDLLEGLSLNVIPGGLCQERNKQQHPNRRPYSDTTNNHDVTTTAETNTTTTPTTTESNNVKLPVTKGSIAFTLPVVDILAEAGSVSFLEGGPPRPETHQHLDDIVDAWTLYNLWEISGAWEALQNDYRIQLAKSLSPVPMESIENNSSVQASWTKRIGQKCASPMCYRIDGTTILNDTGDKCRLCIKCQDCHSELYCSKACRDDSRDQHIVPCQERRKQREERRERYNSSKQISCDTCTRKFSCTKMKKCSSCRQAIYCSVDCQKVDWERHKLFCKR